MHSSRASSLAIPDRGPLRGEIKLRAGLDLFDVDVTGVVALDVGASTGGFTKCLLAAGAARVYSVDVGFGQLLGSLRQDDRVANLEKHNVSELSRDLVPDVIDFITVDVSYLALGAAVEQVSSRVELAPGIRLLGLVKPMFELRLPNAPTDEFSAGQAIEVARSSITDAGWRVDGSGLSPVRGSKGAIEGWVYAGRAN